MLKINTLIGGSIGTNCYVIEDNSDAICIDFIPEAEDFIAKNKLNPEKILLTHIHFDHLEGISKFQKKHNIELILSFPSFENINSPQHNLLAYTSPLETFLKSQIDLNNARTVKDAEILKWKNHEISIMESPGHSAESLMYIVVEEKCVFTGDTIFYLSVGRTDLPGGDFSTMISSIKKLFNKIDDEYTIYPGHGPKTKAGYEKKNNPFLKNI
jgi:hydroxyacylglutathione hydrolase